MGNDAMTDPKMLQYCENCGSLCSGQFCCAECEQQWREEVDSLYSPEEMCE